ncbi:MAG: hypothetical protein ACOC9R_00420 [bacterium]
MCQLHCARDGQRALWKAGYSDATLVTSWGLALPPETPPETVEAWHAVLQEAMATDQVKEAYAETSFTVVYQDVEEAVRLEQQPDSLYDA